MIIAELHSPCNTITLKFYSNYSQTIREIRKPTYTYSFITISENNVGDTSVIKYTSPDEKKNRTIARELYGQCHPL